MNRTIKQTIILIIFIVIIGLVALAGYWILRTPKTCFDGIQNQNETGVDCGGICSKTCEIEKEPLQIILSKIIPTLPDKYNVVVKIHNPNEFYGVGNLNYTVKFFDGSKNFIDSYNGVSYISPRSDKNIIISALDIKNIPESLAVDFGDINWINLPDYKAASLFFVKNKSYKKLTNTTAFSEVRGVVINRSDFDFDRVDVNISLLDSNKNIIDVAKTEIRTLLSKEEREFIYDWFYLTSGVSDIEVEAETNIFRSENFMKRHGAIEEFQKF